MKINKYKLREVFKAEDGETLEVSWTNRTDGGYHEVTRLAFDDYENSKYVSLELDRYEATKLRDLLIKLHPIKDK